MHEDCRHCWIGVGAFLCLKTRLVYVWPNLIPTPKRFKVRPSEAIVFAHKVDDIANMLKGFDVQGFILMNPKIKMVERPTDFAHYVDLLRFLREQKQQQELSPGATE